jgi:hypothetical protein
MGGNGGGRVIHILAAHKDANTRPWSGAQILQNGGPQIIPEFPWQLAQGLVLSHPGWKFASYQQIPGGYYCMVTIDEDGTTYRWIGWQDPDNQWHIAPVDEA